MIEPLVIVLALLAIAIAMFIINRPRMDAVALIMLAALPFTGVLTMQEALAGFSDSSVVLIAAMFVIGDGLVRTGVARHWATGSAPRRATAGRPARPVDADRVRARSVMSSTAITAIFIPVVLRCARSIGSSPSRLMMPLSFAALISGMTTLVASPPNLVVNSELIRRGETGLRFFAFTPFGVPILSFGNSLHADCAAWLPAGSGPSVQDSGRPSLLDWVAKYKLANRQYRLRVTDGSLLVGKALKELKAARFRGVHHGDRTVTRVTNRSYEGQRCHGNPGW